MPRLKLKVKYLNDTSNSKCWSQRELTAYSSTAALIPTIVDDSRSIVRVRQIDGSNPFQMANSVARSTH